MAAKKRSKRKPKSKLETAPQVAPVDLDPIVTQAAEKWDKAYAESLKQGDKPLGHGITPGSLLRAFQAGLNRAAEEHAGHEPASKEGEGREEPEKE